MSEIITSSDLTQIVEFACGYGFAIGVGGGFGAFVLSLIVNTFYGIAQGG